MKCKKCQCIFPATYKLCPDCKSTDFEREKFKVIDKKGDKIAQCTLKEHKGYLLGIESDAERKGGFGSTDK